MSHFYTVVLIPEDTQNVEAELEELLAPYDENIQVDEYDRECYCINTVANRAGWSAAEEEFGPFENLRKAFWDNVEAQIPEGLTGEALWEKRASIADDMNWDAHIKHFSEYAANIEENHELYQKQSPDCEECGGSGTCRSEYNPKSKWDWWVIGGRWNGAIQNNYRGDKDGGFNFGDDFHQLGENVLPAEELIKSILEDENQTPFALVTPEGEWCERGEMGWFGMAHNEKEPDDWRETVILLLEKYPNTIAVGCDLHI